VNDITVLIINYQTPDLLKKAVDSFAAHYPDVLTIVFDNGSKDNSPDLIKSFSEKYAKIQPYFSEKNIFHGPAMDFALRNLLKTKYCFILDSDTETVKAGFLEEMRSILEESEKNYAVGMAENVNQRGFLQSDGKIRIVLSPFMLIKREIYLKFHPFIHHGQPVMFNFDEAAKNGYKIFNYPIEEYIDHLWRGTASRFGYKLGIKGKIVFITEKVLSFLKKRTI
jgi:glycosyltransferase involved in cell wall biosynthesis